jgi:tRNA A58 N-methylase Trm61
MMNVPSEGGRFLRLLAEAIGAKNIVEIGTSNGYSGIWQCLALKATGGKLTTFEIDAQRAALARENFKKPALPIWSPWSKGTRTTHHAGEASMQPLSTPTEWY